MSKGEMRRLARAAAGRCLGVVSRMGWRFLWPLWLRCRRALSREGGDMANGDASAAHWRDAYENARMLLGDAFPNIPSDVSRKEADRIVFRALDARTKGERGDFLAGWSIDHIKRARKDERGRLRSLHDASKSRVRENDAVSRLAPGVWDWIQSTFPPSVVRRQLSVGTHHQG